MQKKKPQGKPSKRAVAAAAIVIRRTASAGSRQEK